MPSWVVLRSIAVNATAARSLSGKLDHGCRNSRIPRHSPRRYFALYVNSNGSRLFADAKLTDDVPVAVGVVCLEIVQQTAAFAHQHQQAAP